MVTALIWFATFTLIVWLLFYMFGDTFCGKAVHAATIGDFVIKGVEGEFYFCKPDIFKKTYDKA